MKTKILIILFLCNSLFGQYQPFPVANFRTAKLLALEPWLFPGDAFSTISNGHLKYGVLEKRRGYSLFGQHVKIETTTNAPTLQTNPVMGIFNYYSGSTEQLMIVDQDRVNKYVTSPSTNISITVFADAGSGEVTVTAASHGFETGDIVTISGTTSYNGTFYITKVNANSFKITDTWVADDGTGTASQEYFTDITKNKIRFKHASKQNWTDATAADVVYGGTSGATGTISAVIVDTGTFAGTNANGTIIFVNESISGTFVTGEELQDNSNKTDIIGESDGAATDDLFTGDNTNYFYVENWEGVSYLTNNNDVIQKYNGTNLSRLHIDLDVEGGPDNDITSAKFIILYKNRLVVFDITERGSSKHQRARWCDVADAKTWKDENYIDADTNEWIQGIAFLGDDLIVWFERSVWLFLYTGDAVAPFRFERIDTSEGCYSPYAVLSFDREVKTVSRTKLVATDGRKAYSIEDKIPGVVLGWAQGSLPYSYGYILDEEKQAWITYASDSASSHSDGNIYPDSVLVINYDDYSFSDYTMPIHSMGMSSLESDVTWNDVSDAWSSIEWSWDDKSLIAGYPNSFFGGRDGKIYKLNDTSADDGSNIAWEVLSGRWNPYLRDGWKAHLGWIDFLVDVDAAESFDVAFYCDTNTTAWQTKTITCTAIGAADERVMKRVYGNITGTFHRIKLSNDATSNSPRVHAIIPYFRRGGVIY
jgi:hypothetical protein